MWWGDHVPSPAVSDMPHTSDSGRPSDRKNSDVPGGIGAAPVRAIRTRPSPTFPSSGVTCRRRASAHSAVRPGSAPLPPRSARNTRQPSVRTAAKDSARAGSAATIASSAPRSFSHSRGAEKNHSGCTETMVGRRAARSSQVVTSLPSQTWK